MTQMSHATRGYWNDDRVFYLVDIELDISLPKIELDISLPEVELDISLPKITLDVSV